MTKPTYESPQLTVLGELEKLTLQGGSPFVTDVPQGTSGNSLEDIVGVVS